MNDILVAIAIVVGVFLLTLVYADEIEDAIRSFIDFVMGKDS